MYYINSMKMNLTKLEDIPIPIPEEMLLPDNIDDLEKKLEQARQQLAYSTAMVEIIEEKINGE